MRSLADRPHLLPTAALSACLAFASLVGCATHREGTFQVRLAMAASLVRQQQWAPALDAVQALYAEAPEEREVLLLRGTIYREQALYAEAERDLRQALAQDDDDPAVHAALGLVLDLWQRGELAEPEHRRAVELAPGEPLYWNNLGFSLFARGKHEEAIAALKEGVARAPALAALRNNLGFALAAAGRMNEAASEFARGGPPAIAKNNLGFAYERAGNLPQAYEAYQAALLLDPDFARAQENFAHVAKALGREQTTGAMPQTNDANTAGTGGAHGSVGERK